MILAKLIPFFICILLGTYQAVAQLDFGTYEIISRASRSRLCSHEAGEQIYVSALWSSCAGGLWALGPGDDRGLYTIKNIGPNSFVQANKMLGSAVVTSNRNTSFVILSKEDHGHIIKLPDGDFVWTVVPGTNSRSDILLQPESGDDTQLWTLIHTNHVTMGHWSPYNFSVQARDSTEEESTLAFLRGVEKLGGSEGYRKYLESPRTAPNYSHIALASEALTNNIYASGNLVSLLIYTEIGITAGEYSGVGLAWGVGLGGIGFVGDLAYNSWDELTSAENGITIVGGGVGANALLILFSVHGNDVAVLTVAGLGAGALLGVHGSFSWTHNS